jgi:protein SCO1/2
MDRRTYLRTAGATGVVGVTALAGCAGRVGFLDRNPDVALPEPDRQYDSEDLPYPAWGQRVPDVTLANPIAGSDVAVRDISDPHFHTFIYTHCMTACPTLQSTLREVQIHAVDEGYADEVSFWPITFDPARDDAERLREEAEQMNVDMSVGNWHYLSPGTAARAESILTDQFGFSYRKDPREDGPYMFTHLALVLLVNGDGYVERAYRGGQYGTDVSEGQLIEDLRTVRKRS